jgi:MoxR-like ATPase
MDEPVNENLEFESRLDLSKLSEKIMATRKEIAKKLVGQQKLVELVLAGILSDGHILIEGVPGIAKTYMAKLVSRVIDATFSRIQFTPDLMPSDIIGTNIFNVKKSEFEFKKGPIFAHVILIDEINRSPAKTQSALFECMEERQVTADGTTYQLDYPFIVLATQNPVEHEGTYRLPEAQLDRFLFKIDIGYPSVQEEVKILEGVSKNIINNNLDDVKVIISKEELMEFRHLISQVRIEANLMKYIAILVENTRKNPNLYLGASPRASIGILNASKAIAAMRGRDFVTPDDIRFVVYPVISHRVVLTPEREMEGLMVKDVIKEIIEHIEVPR